MNFDLKGKNIVITGGLGFLGVEFVKAIKKQNGTPIIIDIQKEIPKDLIGLIGKKDIYVANICIEGDVENISKKILQKYKHINGLINNAANNPKFEEDKNSNLRLENFSMDIWRDDLNVSLTGSYLCTKYFGPIISKNNDGGSIINISSDLGLIAPNHSIYYNKKNKEKKSFIKPVTYSVVKHGIIGLMKYTATYWAEKKVRCNAVCPGGVFNGQDDVFLKKISKLIPMGRMANKEELNGIIIYLLSDSSTYTNGAVISVDGGRTVW